MTAVATRGLQMRAAVFEAEQLERTLWPARETHRLRRRDMARSAIAQLLFSLMRMTRKTLFVAREARLDAARVELMARSATGFRCVVAHQAFIHMRAVRETVRFSRDACEAEFIVARRISEQLRLIVLRDAVLVASRAQRTLLQGVVRRLLKRFAAVALRTGVVEGKPRHRLSAGLAEFHVGWFSCVAVMATGATLNRAVGFHQMLFARMIEIAFALVGDDGGFVRIRRHLRSASGRRRVGLGRKVAL